MEIHRMPAAPASGARPSRTSAKANTSTHDTAKNTVVQAISRLLTSTVRSLRSTSQTMRANTLVSRPAEAGHGVWNGHRGPSHDSPVRGPQRLGTLHRADHPAAAEKYDAVEQPFSDVEVVGGEHDDRTSVSK